MPVKYSNFSIASSCASATAHCPSASPTFSPFLGRGDAALHGGEEAGGGSLSAGDLVERRGKVHATARQRAQAGQSFHDDHTGAEDDSVHGEVFRGEVRQSRAVLLEEIEADVLGPAVYEPLRGLWREVWRLGEVVGPLPVHLIRPVGTEEHDIAAVHVPRPALLQVVDGDPMVSAHEREIDHQRLAHDLVEGDLRGGDAVLEDVERRVDVGARVEALVHARHLPEPGAPVVRRHLEPHIRGGRAHGARVDGDREIDEAAHVISSSGRLDADLPPGPRLASAPRVCYPSHPAKGARMRLRGKVAIVTGAAKGIGADVLALRADVTRSADIDRALAAVVARWDRIDILVNNAGGFAVIRATEEIAEEEWHAILASNLTSVFLCSKAVLTIMKRQRYGRIVNLASVVGRAGAVRVTSHYAAAKAGVIGFTRHLALEVGADGITVNAVAPGTTATERVLRARTPEA